MRWPDLPQPTPAHAAAFRRCLRHTLCTTTSPWQQAGQYSLDKKLGAWFIRPRLCLHTCYASHQAIYWQDDLGTYHCNPSGTAKFYTINYTKPSTPPKESHPVAARHMSANSIFVWKRYRPHALSGPPSEDHIIGDTFQEEGTGRLNLVSDASIHVAKRKAAGVWHLFAASSDNGGTQRVV